VFALGDRVQVELTEVDLASGQLTFRQLDHSPGPAARAAASRGGRRGHLGPRRRMRR
jgi:hypothetical protein